MEWPAELIWITGTEHEVLNDALFPFALDEVWCRRFGQGELPAVHVWRHPSALVLGLRDRKLPNAGDTMDGLRAEGISVVVRNSGGAVVPLDAGVVNVSLLLPLPDRTRDFRDDFQYMADWIAGAAAPWHDTVRPGEISGAYCPGDFDLSIHGKKFCGISQRRQAKGFSVQAFVNVEGTGEERSRRAVQFYKLASGEDEQSVYPRVEEGRTGALQELCGVPGTQAYIDAMRIWLEKRGIRIIEHGLNHDLIDEIRETAEKLRTRYDK